jgi:hypothetical protein
MARKGERRRRSANKKAKVSFGPSDKILIAWPHLEVFVEGAQSWGQDFAFSQLLAQTPSPQRAHEPATSTPIEQAARPA